jgi:hypothetical protein
MPARAARAPKTSHQTNDQTRRGLPRRVLLLAHAVLQKQKREPAIGTPAPNAALHQRLTRAFRINLIVPGFTKGSFACHSRAA